jgi:L-ascorbate metabolism protein UlaG (beta-lactamase superfamily)
MEITYLGHSSFKLKNKEGMVVILDPFHPDYVGLPFVKDVADIVTISHEHEDHNAREMITGPVKRESTFVIDKEGEYEIGGIEISSIKTYHDNTEGSERGKNIITALRIDDVVVLHLGDLGHKLSESVIERVGSVDVLMVRVGGDAALNTDAVFDLIKEIQPSYVIPMHYKIDGMKDIFPGLPTLQNFLDKNKFPVAGESVHKIKIDKDTLPDDTQVLLMNG